MIDPKLEYYFISDPKILLNYDTKIDCKLTGLNCLVHVVFLIQLISSIKLEYYVTFTGYIMLSLSTDL